MQGRGVGTLKSWGGVMKGDFEARGIDPKSTPWLAKANDTWRIIMCSCTITSKPVAARSILRQPTRFLGGFGASATYIVGLCLKHCVWHLRLGPAAQLDNPNLMCAL